MEGEGGTGGGGGGGYRGDSFSDSVPLANLKCLDRSLLAMICREQRKLEI